MQLIQYLSKLFCIIVTIIIINIKIVLIDIMVCYEERQGLIQSINYAHCKIQ